MHLLVTWQVVGRLPREAAVGNTLKATTSSIVTCAVRPAFVNWSHGLQLQILGLGEHSTSALPFGIIRIKYVQLLCHTCFDVFQLLAQLIMCMIAVYADEFYHLSSKRIHQ